MDIFLPAKSKKDLNPAENQPKSGLSSVVPLKIPENLEKQPSAWRDVATFTGGPSVKVTKEAQTEAVGPKRAPMQLVRTPSR